MAETFDGAREPMRALRDLIVACEMTFDGDGDILRRAQDAFTALRALHGDTRPAEEVGEAVMIEPAHPSPPAQICAGSAGTRIRAGFAGIGAGSAAEMRDGLDDGICAPAPDAFADIETAVAAALDGDAGFALLDGPLTRRPA